MTEQVVINALFRQVIPFLVLAVGVDNIFMLVHAFDRIDRMKYSSSSERIGEALGTIGPSILLTSLSECCCFGIGNLRWCLRSYVYWLLIRLHLGSLSNMPAVKTFALYSTVAIFLNFIFQITVFVALMSLDQRRFEVWQYWTLSFWVFVKQNFVTEQSNWLAVVRKTTSK